MTSFVNQLSPDQVKTIIATYDTIEAWLTNVAVDFIDTASIVIEDVMI